MIVVLAIAGYFVFVPQTVADQQRLDALVVQRSGIAGLPAAPSGSSAGQAAAGLPALAAAAKSSPASTGTWSTDWIAPGKNAVGAESYLVLDLLPTVKQATTLRGQLVGAYLAKSTYTGQKYAETAAFEVPAAKADRLASSAATYRRVKSKTEPAGTITTVVEQVGRADAIVYVQLGTASRAQATALATSELALLRRVEPGFTLISTNYPWLASLLWWVVAAALALIAWGGPKLVVAARERARAHQEALARAQFQMRGQKVLKRRGGPQRSAAGRRGARR